MKYFHRMDLLGAPIGDLEWLKEEPVMNEDVYPQGVDFNYKVRCSQHNFKPYVYCEMCMVRSELQSIKDEVARETRHMVASCNLNVAVTHDVLEKQAKQIEELKIEIQLLKERISV